MNSDSWLLSAEESSSKTKSEALQKRTDEIAAEMYARAEKRRLAFEELRSVLYSPQDRISAWEKLHGLRLPLDSKHAVLLSIARSTELTLEQVQGEQEARKKKAGGLEHPPDVGPMSN